MLNIKLIILKLTIIEMGNCADASDGTISSPIPISSSIEQKTTKKQHRLKILQESLKLKTMIPSQKQTLQLILLLLDQTDQQSLLKLGKACQSLKLYNNAIQCYLQYMKISQQKIMRSIVNGLIADCYVKIGKHRQALDLYQKLLVEEEKASQRKSYRFARLLYRVGSVKATLGFRNQAILCFHEGIALIQKMQIINVPEQCQMYCKLAELDIQNGQPHLSVYNLHKAIEATTKMHQGIQKSQILCLIGNLCQQIGNNSLSSKLYQLAEKMLLLKVKKQSQEYIRFECSKSIILKQQKQYKKAECLLDQCLPNVKRLFGEVSVLYCEVKKHQGMINLATGHNIQALKMFSQAIKIYQKLDEYESQTVATMLIQSSSAYLKIGSSQKFQQTTKSCFQLVKRLSGQNSIQQARMSSKLLQLIFSTKLTPQAIQASQQIIQIYETKKFLNHPNYFRALITLATSQMYFEKYEEAAKHCFLVIDNYEPTEKQEIINEKNGINDNDDHSASNHNIKVNNNRKVNQIYSQACSLMAQLYAENKYSLELQKEERITIVGKIKDEMQKIELEIKGGVDKLKQIQSINCILSEMQKKIQNCIASEMQKKNILKAKIQQQNK